MKRTIAGMLALTVLSSTWLLGSEGDMKTKAKAKAKKPAAAPISAQLQQMQDQLNQQQQHNNQQEQRINQLQQQLQQTQQQLQSEVQQASQQAQAAQQAASAAQQTANSLSSSVVDLKTSTATFNQSLTTTQKDVKSLLSPLAIRFKGVDVVPYGWVDLGIVGRTRNTNSDMGTPFPAIPLNGTQNAGFSEFRISARQTRPGVRAISMPNTNVRLEGRLEIDFEGTPIIGANENQTTSYVPRIRHLFGQAEWLNSGWVLTFGQTYNLWTANKVGINADREWVVPGEEGSYVVGITYGRTGLVRATKYSANKKVAFAVEASNPATTLSSSYTPVSVLGIPGAVNLVGGNYNTTSPCCSAFLNATTGGALNASGLPAFATGVTTNPMPDFLGKIAFDPGWGHYEIRAMFSAFRDRVALQTAGGIPYTAVPPSVLPFHRTNTTYGGGLGWFSFMPVTKKTDWILSGTYGAGTSKFNGAGNADTTLDAQYKLVPIKNITALTGIEMHPTPKVDLFAYFGAEYYGRSGNGYADLYTAGKVLGFGSPNYTGAPAYNKSIWSPSFGYNYRFYQGPAGVIMQAFELAYIERNLWRSLGVGPSRGDIVVGDISFKYFLP
jgi:hypothetical protein